MGYTLSVQTGYGVEIDDEAWDRIEELWNAAHPDSDYAFEEDRFWHAEQVLAQWPELELECAGYMDYEEGYAIFVKDTVIRTYGAGIESIHERPLLLLGQAKPLYEAIEKLWINNHPEWLVAVNYG